MGGRKAVAEALDGQGRRGKGTGAGDGDTWLRRTALPENWLVRQVGNGLLPGLGNEFQLF